MEWIDAATAAARLGVKPATLYAYVSRGVLRRRHSEDGRRSLFDAAEIEQLARRGRPRSQPPELVVESAITALGADRPYYRGRDALELARTNTFEAVALFLWSGDARGLAAEEEFGVLPGGPWRAGALDAAVAAQRALPDGVLPLDRLQVATTVLAATDPMRFSLAGPAVIAAGQRLIAGLVDSLPRLQPTGGPHAGAEAIDTPAPGGGPTTPEGALTRVREAGVGADGSAHRRSLGLGGASIAEDVPTPLREEGGEGIATEGGAGRGVVIPHGAPDRSRGEHGASDPSRDTRGKAVGSRGARGEVVGPRDARGEVVGSPGAGGEVVGVRGAAGGSSAVPGAGGESIAERLWAGLTAMPPTPELIGCLQAALVLLADHELAASTLAARVAASAKADPYAVVLTGLGVLSGPLHGGASYGAERLLAEVAEPGQASRVIAERVRRGERIPGFGHTVYKNGDARGEALLDLVQAAVPGNRRIDVVLAVLAEMRRRRLPEQNVDFALAALTAAGEMVSGAGEAIFAVARTAGWLAHAMEEYQRGVLLRLRASYTGPPTS